MSVISAEQLSKNYGRRIGVERVQLDVAQGELFGFLGPNGAGKSTTIRLLLGFLRPTDGRARVLGLDAWHSSHLIKRHVGYLPGDLRLYPWMTGRRALGIVARIRGQDLGDAGADLADRFGLEMNLRVAKMSRGMRQKLGLIMALVHRPRLLVLDEPTSGLDPLMQDALTQCLRELSAEGTTVFFSSHTLSEVQQLCHRIAIVREGRIVADETLDSLRRRARRSAKLTFENDAAAAAAAIPDWLDVQQRGGRVRVCELTGDAQRLVRWAAAQPIVDLEIGPPDLESLFRAYYRSGESPS